jgi:small subunit ribosomal protein S14
MPRKAQKVRWRRPSKFKTRQVNSCFRCGRARGFMRDFGLCRICFRELAHRGYLPGIKKSSW